MGRGLQQPPHQSPRTIARGSRTNRRVVSERASPRMEGRGHLRWGSPGRIDAVRPCQLDRARGKRRSDHALARHRWRRIPRHQPRPSPARIAATRSSRSIASRSITPSARASREVRGDIRARRRRRARGRRLRRRSSMPPRRCRCTRRTRSARSMSTARARCSRPRGSAAGRPHLVDGGLRRAGSPSARRDRSDERRRARTAPRRSRPSAVCLRARGAPARSSPILRPKSFVGPERLGVFAIMYEWAREGRDFPILGRGTNRYQLLDVEDLCDGDRARRHRCRPSARTTRSTSARPSSRRCARTSRPCSTPPATAGASARCRWRRRCGRCACSRSAKLSPLYPWIYETVTEDSFVSIDRARSSSAGSRGTRTRTRSSATTTGTCAHADRPRERPASPTACPGNRARSRSPSSRFLVRA